jgi:hypothetical protein
MSEKVIELDLSNNMKYQYDIMYIDILWSKSEFPAGEEFRSERES